MADSVPASPTPSAMFAATLRAAILTPLQASALGSSAAATPIIPSEEIEEIEEIAPSLDRSIDVDVSIFQASSDFGDFMLGLPFVAAGSQTPPFFQLPLHIRHSIYEQMFTIRPHEAKISLSPEFATKAVFPADYFKSPDDILWELEGGLSTCRQLRDEIMTYFLTKYKFHVTLSPFTATITSPLSQQWLPLYADRVQNLTIEIDLTRFGLGPMPTAVLLKSSTKKMTDLLKAHIEGLKRRRGTIFNLHLMCRRYAGLRPQKKSEQSDEPVPYCPVDAMTVCDSVTDLQGTLQNLRMTGFTQEYTDHIINGLYGDDDVPPQYFDPFDDAWPVELPIPPTPASHMNPSPATSVIASTVSGSPAIPFPGPVSGAANSPSLSMLNEPGLAARLGLNNSKLKSPFDDLDKKKTDPGYDEGLGGESFSPSMSVVSQGSKLATPRAPSVVQGGNFQGFAGPESMSTGSFNPLDNTNHKTNGKWNYQISPDFPPRVPKVAEDDNDRGFAYMDLMIARAAASQGVANRKTNDKENYQISPDFPPRAASVDSDTDYLDQLVAQMNFDNGPLSPDTESACENADRVAAKYDTQPASTDRGRSVAQGTPDIRPTLGNINDPAYLEESDRSYDFAGRARSDSSKKRFSKFIDKLKGNNA